MAKADIRFREALQAARGAFEHAQADLEILRMDIGEREAEVIRLRRTVAALADLCGEPIGLEQMGITDAIRKVIDNATEQLSMRQIKDGLAELGFDLSTQKNPTASVMAVLKRLVDGKQVKRQNIAGESVWIGPHATVVVPSNEDEIPF